MAKRVKHPKRPRPVDPPPGHLPYYYDQPGAVHPGTGGRPVSRRWNPVISPQAETPATPFNPGGPLLQRINGN